MPENIATTVTQAFDDSTKQINDASTSMLTAAKKSALASIDVYEKSVSTILDVQSKFVESTGFPVTKGFVTAQIKFAADLNAAGVSAARSVFA